MVHNNWGISFAPTPKKIVSIRYFHPNPSQLKKDKAK
jgi:hypothetical protein